MNGNLYLIPTPLGDYPPQYVLTPAVLELLPKIKLFFVEELRTARRFLSAAGLKGQIDALELHELNVDGRIYWSECVMHDPSSLMMALMASPRAGANPL